MAPFLRSLSLPGETDTWNNCLKWNVTELGRRTPSAVGKRNKGAINSALGQPQEHRLPFCCSRPSQSPHLLWQQLTSALLCDGLWRTLCWLSQAHRSRFLDQKWKCREHLLSIYFVPVSELTDFYACSHLILVSQSLWLLSPVYWETEV